MAEPRGFDRNYRRGAVMGLTVAEAFILLAFCLLLLFSWWQVETERKSLIAADEIAHLTDAQKAEIVEGLSDGTFQIAAALRQQMAAEGLPVAGPEAVADARQFSRFMSEQDLKRLMQGAAELPPETRLRLADTVAMGDARRLTQAMDRIEAETPAETQDPTQRISQRLAEAEAAERRLVQTLEDRLGGTIRAAGGSIGADGAISLPQSVLFEVDNAQVKNPGFLRDFCAPWLQTLRQSGVDISELKIEGHASSEGPPGASPERAYLYNLDLSQRRAQNALRVCLSGVDHAPVQAWARDHLTAVGYSSNRLIRQPDGSEDRDASRRVMFSVAVDRQPLLEQIQDDIARDDRPAPRPAQP